MRFGILKKFICAFLVLSLIPLIGLSYHTWYRMNRSGRGVVESTRTALVENAARVGEALIADLQALIPEYQFLKEVRGKGMMIGIEFGPPKSLKLKDLGIV